MSCPVMSMELPNEAPHAKCRAKADSAGCGDTGPDAGDVFGTAVAVSATDMVSAGMMTSVTSVCAWDAVESNNEDVMNIEAANLVIVIPFFVARGMPSGRANLL